MAAWFNVDKTALPNAEDALPGRAAAIVQPGLHHLLGTPIAPPYPESTERAVFAMGCFWGAEKIFWTVPGVITTAVGYVGGSTPNPTYQEVCTGATGHTEGVLVVYEPQAVAYAALLELFWEGHDPTQGMRQGNDRGSQYRSAIFTTSAAQQQAATASRAAYGEQLSAAGFAAISSEIAPLTDFYFAEQHHQQYLAKNLGGYCGLGGTGVACPVGVTG